MTLSARTWTLAARPHGLPRPDDFRLETQALPDPGPGEVALKMLWLSLDPYMRGRMSEGRSYAPPTPLGQALPSEAVARVITSRDPSLAVGDLVRVYDGWRDHAVRRAADCRRIPPGATPPQAWLGVMGMPGLTAWAGLRHIGKPRPGETLVVGAASGAVGSLVGQIARLRGARVVGVAGGAEKCAWVTGALGFDACLDRHAPDLAGRMEVACPQGVDVYFELTGGAVCDAVLPLFNPFARVPVCGTIASYNATEPPPGPDRLPQLMRLVLTRSLTLRGFIVSEFAADEPAFEAEMAAWLAAGAIRYREDVTEGFESMVDGFIGILQGKNFGKALVKVAE